MLFHLWWWLKLHYFFWTFKNFSFYYAISVKFSLVLFWNLVPRYVSFFLACMSVCSHSTFSLINIDSGYYFSLLFLRVQILVLSTRGWKFKVYAQHHSRTLNNLVVGVFNKLGSSFHSSMETLSTNFLQSRWCKSSVAAHLLAQTILLIRQHSLVLRNIWEPGNVCGNEKCIQDIKCFVCWYFVVYFKCLGNGKEAHGLHVSAANQPIGAPDQYQMAQEKNKLCTYIN